MKKLKNKIESIKNNKFKALFNDITPTEYILICIPFTISMASTRGISQSTFGFVMLAMSMMLGLGILFLIGLRYRILFFSILLFISVFLIIYIGRPWEHWLMADRDSQIRAGIEAILSGENPYKAKTHSGHKVNPLPFTFIFYLPMYLITGGYPYYMSIIIMILFCIVLLYNCVDTNRDYLILPIISFITFSDYFYIEVASNSDLINSGLILCMILFLIPDEIPQQKKLQNKLLQYFSIIPEEPKDIDKKIVLFAIFFGCLLAMRTHFWLIGIIVALYIFKIYGFRNSLYLSVITIGVFLTWILPFMLQDVDYFINVNPLGHNTSKFYPWRSYDSVEPFGYLILDFLNVFLNYNRFNAIIISCSILIGSLVLGLIKCENKLHFLLIFSFCNLVFIFFYFFGPDYGIVRDYVSMAAIPFVFAFLYINSENNDEKKQKN